MLNYHSLKMTEDSNRRHHRFIFFGSLTYLVGVSSVMLRHNIWFSPDQFFIFALVLAIFLGRGKRFIADWAPVILVFMSYEFFRGAIPAIAQFPIHSQDIIDAERFLFGTIPTLALQNRFLDINHYQWYDFLLTLTYMSFWVCPLVFAYFIWVKNRPLFKFMTLALFITLYATFTTFVFFPSMPPWMAADKGLLPTVHRLLYSTTAYLTTPGALPTFYSLFRGNEIAAIPSTHLELPTLMILFAVLFKNKLLIFLTSVYLLLVFFSVVYLGEHYVIDGLAGISFAVGSFFLAKFLGHRFNLIAHE